MRRPGQPEDQLGGDFRVVCVASVVLSLGDELAVALRPYLKATIKTDHPAHGYLPDNPTLRRARRRDVDGT